LNSEIDIDEKEIINSILKIEEIILTSSSSDVRIELFKLILCKYYQNSIHENVSELNDLNALLLKAILKFPNIELEPQFSIDKILALECYKYLDNININSYSIIEHIFEFISTQNSKANKGQFFTPRYVIAELIKPILPYAANSIIADIACGSGGFLASIANNISENSKYFGFDFDPMAILTANILSTVLGKKITYTKCDSLIQTNLLFEISQITIENFMRLIIPKFSGFDLIITNPPFGGSITDKNILSGYTINKNKSAKRDILFIERCHQLLKVNGLLVIVLPSNIFSDVIFEYQRKWILEHFDINTILSLHRDTFLPHTHQKTNVIYANKKQIKSIDKQKAINFIISESSGKDNKGRLLRSDNLINSDLSEAVKNISF